MRRTRALVAVANSLLSNPDAKHWGYNLSMASGVRSGALYPILSRLLDAGWLTDGWEDQTETAGKRPPRRYYRITCDGRAALDTLVRGGSA